jgi:hypothetical protein
MIIPQLRGDLAVNYLSVGLVKCSMHNFGAINPNAIARMIRMAVVPSKAI